LKTLIAAVAALPLAVLAADPSLAQARRGAAAPAARPAAATPAPALNSAPLVSGPPIAGVCIFSFDRALATSAAGKAAATRMQQLTAQVQAELQPEQTSLQTDAKTFESQRATLPADQVQTRGQALQTRLQTYEQKAQLRQQELRATGGKAQQRIGQEMEPIVRSVYQAKSCSVLLNGEGVLGANPQMDLTDTVVGQLNAKMPTITFDREHLDQQAAAAR
jgi:Skp family chaperone for outer membrane proteins